MPARRASSADRRELPAPPPIGNADGMARLIRPGRPPPHRQAGRRLLGRRLRRVGPGPGFELGLGQLHAEGHQVHGGRVVGVDLIEAEVVEATAADLDLWLWGRADAAGLDVVGDPSIPGRIRAMAAADRPRCRSRPRVYLSA